MNTSDAYLATTLARGYTEDRLRDARNRHLAREAQRRQRPPTAEPARQARGWSLVRLRRVYG
jgi:hypothetical protein